jgi:hypothetical protein
MRVRFAFDWLRPRWAGAALAAGAFAAACGKIGYDPELAGGHGSDASLDAGRPDAGALDGAPDERAEPPADVAIENPTGDGPFLDALADSDAGSTAIDASDASFADAGGSVCPKSFQLIDPRNTPLRGGFGGSEASELCPAGQAIVGLVGKTSNNGYLNLVQAVCGRLTAIDTLTTCEVATVAGAMLTMHGDPLAPGRRWTMTCPAGQVAAGIRGRAGSATDQLALECAPLSISKSGGSFRVSVGSRTALPAQGGPGGAPFDDPCGVDRVANGVWVRSGAGIDAFAIFCASVSAMP